MACLNSMLGADFGAKNSDDARRKDKPQARPSDQLNVFHFHLGLLFQPDGVLEISHNMEIDAVGGIELQLLVSRTGADGEPHDCFAGIVTQPIQAFGREKACLLYTSPSPRDGLLSRMPSSA